MAPAKDRWKPMFLRLAVFAIAAGAAVSLEPPKAIEALLLVVGLGAWVVGACAMVGYARWFYVSEVSQAKRSNDESRAGTGRRKR